MSYPVTAAVPEVAERSPVRILNVVVFPAPNRSTNHGKVSMFSADTVLIVSIPFTPSRPKHSPCGMAKLIPFTADLVRQLVIFL